MSNSQRPASCTYSVSKQFKNPRIKSESTKSTARHFFCLNTVGNDDDDWILRRIKKKNIIFWIIIKRKKEKEEYKMIKYATGEKQGKNH